jgi:hypothetical protein
MLFVHAFGKESPARFLIHCYHRDGWEFNILKEGPSVRFAYQIPDIASFSSPDVLEHGCSGYRNIFIGERQRSHKGIKDEMEKGLILLQEYFRLDVRVSYDFALTRLNT